MENLNAKEAPVEEICEETVNANVMTVGEIVDRGNLSIPNYQRPYRWETKNVEELIQDINEFTKGGKTYRLGTLVLHKNNNIYDIVDGQQRIVTIGLLLNSINGTKYSENKYLDAKCLGNNNESIMHIKENYKCIQEYGNVLKEDSIIKQCEFVVIELKNLSEAFQFFDSQNSKGKDLEAYDLLKSYHLREIDLPCKYERDKINIQYWHNIANTERKEKVAEMKETFDMLYRIKKWSQKCKAGEHFEKSGIAQFKGISGDSDYPCYRVERLLHDNWEKGKEEYPFQINSKTLDGNLFFAMFKHYHDIYCKISKGDFGCPEIEDKPEWKVVYDRTSYEKYKRKGDKCVRWLIHACTLLYIDKFGLRDIQNVFTNIVKYSFYIRLDRERLRLSTVENEAISDDGIFHRIVMAQTHTDVLEYKSDKWVEFEYDDKQQVKSTKYDGHVD